MDESEVTIRSLEKSLEEERVGKQRQTTGGPGERSRFHQGSKRKKSRRKEERRATRMRENTERRESKSPGRALWGWINTTPPRIREGATIHQPPRSCVSFSCTLTTTSILNQTPLLFSFHPRFWQPPASFHGVGARTNPLFGGVGDLEHATN